MASIEQQVATINHNVASVLTLLRGHEMDNDDKGMIGLLNDHETRIEKIEKKFDRITYTVMGMTIPAGYGIVNFLKFIITKI